MTRRLRILTANLWNVGGADPDALARLVADRDVDVAALQELAADHAGAIAEVLPHGKLEPAEDHSGMGIALRHPAEVEALPLHRRAGRVARLDWPHLCGEIEVLNVHVRAPHSFPFWQALADRRRQLRELLGHLDGNPNPSRVVVGDFNATPVWPVYRGVARRLRDAAREHAERHGRRPAATWGPRPGLPRMLRIDHAFVAELDVGQVEVVRLDGSDHSGVLVDIELP